MSEIRQGQVYWLDFGPVTGSAPAQRHPCVVVQNDVFNRSAIHTSVVCLITSNLSEASLPKASVVNVSQILTVDKAELAEPIGKLSGAAAQAVRDGLHLLFDRL